MKKFAILAACAALAACGSQSDDKQAVTAKIGGVEVTANGKVELPAGYDVYPGAKVITNGKLGNAQSTDYNVVMEAADTPEKVIAYYTKQAAAGGFPAPTATKDGDTQSLMARTDSGNIFSLTAFPQDGKTSATLFLEIKGS